MVVHESVVSKQANIFILFMITVRGASEWKFVWSDIKKTYYDSMCSYYKRIILNLECVLWVKTIPAPTQLYHILYSIYSFR